VTGAVTGAVARTVMRTVTRVVTRARKGVCSLQPSAPALAAARQAQAGSGPKCRARAAHSSTTKAIPSRDR